MKLNTKDPMGHFELTDLLNKLGKHQGYKTPIEWDDFLHSYCSSLLDGGQDY